MRTIALTILCVALALAAGCASSSKGGDGQRLGKELGKDLESCTEALSRLETDLRAVLASHQSIVQNADGDFARHYKAFGKGLDKLEKTRQIVRARYDEVNASAGAYFAAWKSGSESFSSDSMRASSQKLLEKMQKEFSDIWEETPGARQAYGELTKMLGDHRLYWSNVLNQDTAKEMKKDSKKIDGASKLVFEGIAEASKAALAFDDSINVKPPEKTTGTTTPASSSTKSGTTGAARP